MGENLRLVKEHRSDDGFYFDDQTTFDNKISAITSFLPRMNVSQRLLPTAFLHYFITSLLHYFHPLPPEQAACPELPMFLKAHRRLSPRPEQQVLITAADASAPSPTVFGATHQSG